MTELTIEGVPGTSLSDADLSLLVSGVNRTAQSLRLRAATLVIRKAGRIVAAASCSYDGPDFRVDELGVRAVRADDDLPEQLIDLMETLALAADCHRLVLSSSAGSMRRALRWLGYVPQTQGRRLSFVRRLGRQRSGEIVPSPSGKFRAVRR